MKQRLKATFFFGIIVSYMFINSNDNEIFREEDMNFVQYCNFHDYPVQQHKILTDDGYILTLYRIQKKYTQIYNNQEVVLLQHGLLDTAFSFVSNDEDQAPGFILANNGYDVWLGNFRGNFQSLEHSQLSSTYHGKFWDFSIDEMARHDIPSMFKYIIEHTNGRNTQIHFVGHSMACMVMLAALSQPSINYKIQPFLQHFIALAPAVFLKNTNSFPLAIYRYVIGFIVAEHYHEFSFQFLPQKGFIAKLLQGVCSHFDLMCALVHNALGNLEANDLDNQDRLNVIYSKLPAGTSVQNMMHFEQIFIQNQFAKFDYGSEQNILLYGQSRAPLYDLTNVRHPKISIFCGTRDQLAHPIDTLNLQNKLTNVKHLNYLEFDMAHQTFMFGKDPQYLDFVLKILQEQSPESINNLL